MKSIRNLLTLFMLLCASVTMAQRPSLIPQPNEVAWGSGQLVLSERATISCANAQLRPAATYLSQLLRRATGFKMKQKSRKGTIRLALTTEGKAGSYRLEVTPRGVSITGRDYAGVISGIQTLRQLFSDDIERKTVQPDRQWTLPTVTITDAPRFTWRGMELDCSRHFFTKQEVEDLLDVLALYKINRFHWHLTDDQGWRIEIKRYPKLTANGAWRTLNNQDSICIDRAQKEGNPDLEIQPSKMRTMADGSRKYGGYYTQEDIREVVDYARVRGIDVIPELDMPGHSLIAIRNYDGLSCFPETGWGRFFTTPMCPGKDAMLEFCKNVWLEVFQLFPSRYVHIGGDEVDMTNWKKCPDCQRRMREHHLTDVSQLQSWFNHYMEDFFRQHGRTMIGWDEIIAGGLSKTSTVMWWRSWNKTALTDATAHGNPVICTPNAQFYLDYDEDRKSIPNIYAFNPTPDSLSASQKALVLGVQGNLWAEWLPSLNRMQYMAFPRMLAIAELGWSQPEDRQLPDFQRRMVNQLGRLRKLNIRYRTPDISGFHRTNVFIDSAVVRLQCPDPSATIRYTTDGTLPQATSKLYTGPMTITESTKFNYRTFDYRGRKGETVVANFLKEDYAPAVRVDTLAKGLRAEWYDYTGATCAGIDTVRHLGSFVIPEVMIPRACKDNIGLVITGFIDVPADGIYTFSLLSDDGSYLMLDGRMVVDNDGEHSPREIVGQHAMRKGLHPLILRYFDHNGGELRLQVMDQAGRPVKVGYGRE